MIGMRVIVADHAKPAASGIVIRALGLGGGYQIASLLRLLAFVLGGKRFAENVGLAFAGSQQKSTAFVRVRLLAVLSDLIEVLLFNLDCHVGDCPSLEIHFVRRLHRDHMRPGIKAIKQRVVMRDDLRCSQKLVIHGSVSVAYQGDIVAHAYRSS